MDITFPPQPAFKRPRESVNSNESLNRTTALCSLSAPDAGNGGKNGEERIGGGAPIWHRSRSQQIEIDNSNCHRHAASSSSSSSSAPSFVCLRTSFLQIVLRLLAVTVWQILRRWTSLAPIPFLTALNSYLNRFSRILILTTCVVIYGSAADIRPPLSRDVDFVVRSLPPTGSRVPLLVPSLICCISDLAFGVTNKKTLSEIDKTCTHSSKPITNAIISGYRHHHTRP